MGDYKMTIMRKDFATTYEYRQAIKFWRNAGRAVRRVPGGVEVVGSSFCKEAKGARA
ncbi:MAG: hypothetical protein J6V72_05145 [Kiritimatiellae bacterium]|nr:hypothetical protein [Kiritimatiellia bacterium]